MLKLATLPQPNNVSALIVRLCWDGLLECWASPAILEEYCVVLSDEPEVLALIQDRFQVCYPLITLDCIQHEPDNRFIECALAADAEFLVTVNTARGHFDRPCYGRVRVVTPGAFVNLGEVRRLIEKVRDRRP